MRKRILAGTIIVIAFIGIIWLIFGTLSFFNQEALVIGSKERILLITPNREVEVIAKIDTGADLSSIDEQFAHSMGFEINTFEKKTIITEQGAVERDTISSTFILADREISSIFTLADRSGFSTVMIIGKNDLQGFRVDASRQFLTQPDAAKIPLIVLIFSGFLNRETGIGKVIITIPILCSVVVLLRLFAGIRTYGVFAPVVIALSLFNFNVISGILIYIFLLTFGIGAKFLILNRLKLSHIAEFALIMFILVAILTGVLALPVGFTLSSTTLFFPLIITSHLIEQASKTLEEHSISAFLSVITTTFAIALLLAFFGSFLLEQSLVMLWVIFAFSVLATIVAGNYRGLRLTEFFRFKFLGKSHEHI